MENQKQQVLALFKSNNIQVPASRMDRFNSFLHNEQNKNTINLILQSQQQLMGKWKLEERIADIQQQSVRIKNATVGKPYEAVLDMETLNWKDLWDYTFDGLEAIGLQFDSAANKISGIPTQSGDLKLVFRFKVEGQKAEDDFQEKLIPLIVNPDPKTLWKNLESDKNDPFWKEDNVSLLAPLGDRHILVSSKRGRSHANVGSFREDDFAFKELDNGWCVVVVSDGAGSAKVSRKGSALACQEVVNFFSQEAIIQGMMEFDGLIGEYNESAGEEIQKKLNRLVYDNLGKAAFHVHKKLETFAAEQAITLKDLSSTLIFALFKKYANGYAVLSFGVGDCPMAVLNKEITEVTLLNWIDVGEFGGGTRFITMQEIFQNDKFATRFGFKFFEDFSYMVLMSDGIYDPKFVVEANLPDVTKWQAFLADLQGSNEEGAGVELNVDNPDITEQLSRWMDFWSPGNHDDRTLALVF